MKKSVVTFVVISVIGVAGAVIYLNRQNPLPAPTPVMDAVPRTVELTPPTVNVAPPPAPPRQVVNSVKEPAPAPVPNAVASDLPPPAPSVPHSKAGDTLVSAQTSFSDRQALLKKIKKSGELDSAIAELKQRAVENPNDAGIPIALGEAIMNKFPVKDFSEASTLGLQIDQNFDAALKIDPTNWEAQFEKVNSMSYWPDVAGKGPEVIQRLVGLIDQQETMSAQPQFARTYVLLGEQYQKIGQADNAQATWQLGAQKFPNDPVLLKKINGQ